jgi:carbonic anhydrase
MLAVSVPTVYAMKHYSTANTRNDRCTAGVAFSPIELNLPSMDYLPFQIKMEFANLNQTNMTKRDNNHMIYTGEFGNVSYLDMPYSVGRVDIFSPSLHMAYGVVYPLEVQLKAKNTNGDVITLAYLFDKFGNNHNQFLNTAGFQNGRIKNMSVSNEEVILTNDFSLKNLVEEKVGFMMYEGQSLVETCEPSLYFISNEITWMSETQFQELIPTGQMKETVAKPTGMVIYQNFMEGYGIKPTLFNSSIELSRFPVNLQNVPAMYLPDEYRKLGYIPPDYIPAWQQLNGTLEDQVLLPAPKDMKLQAFCYKPLRPGVYTTQYILVPKDYQLALNTQPETIEIFIRTNTQQHNGVRDIIKILMPVEYNPIDKAAIEAIRQEEKKRFDAEKAIVQKKEEIKKVQAQAVQKRLQLERATSTKTLKFKRICEKWEVESIMNRHWDNEQSWDLPDLITGGEKDLLVCKKWKVVLVNDDGKEVQEKPIPDIPVPTIPQAPSTPAPPTNTTAQPQSSPSNQTTPPPPPIELPDIGPIDTKQCGTYLTLVLNQRFSNLRVKDYVLDKCKSWQSQDIPKATALAMINSELKSRKRLSGGATQKQAKKSLKNQSKEASQGILVI